MKGSKVVALGATLAFLATAIIPVSAGTHTVTLTNGVGCGSGSGAYGPSYVIWDLNWSLSSVRTHRNSNAGCQVRYLYRAQFYYGGQWHIYTHDAYWTQNIIYNDADHWPTSAQGKSHRICGVGPVCGSSKDTSAGP